jgi:hypothetical protein
MSRLRKLKKSEEREKATLSKTASSPYLYISSEVLGSGDVIGINARLVNRKPWYQVYLEYDVGIASSFYDGPDAESAFSMYGDVLTAFKGVKVAEGFSKQIPLYVKQIQEFGKGYGHQGLDEYYELLTKQLMHNTKFLSYYDK